MTATFSISLTGHELEILRHASTGQTSKEISAQLSISFRTVDFHIANIYDKLKVRNKIQALSAARAKGLL